MFLFSIRIFQERVGFKISPGLLPVLVAQYKVRDSPAWVTARQNHQRNDQNETQHVDSVQSSDVSGGLRGGGE